MPDCGILDDAGRLYWTFRRSVTPLYRWCWRVRVEGLQHVPSDGPIIVAANHISFFDSVVLGLATPRRMFFLGKAEYLDSWKTRTILPALGMIPLQRSGGRESLDGLATGIGVLERGHALGIYPEGTRSRDGKLHKGHTGVAHLAMETGAPIVPVGLIGTDLVQPPGARLPRPFRPIRAAFGTVLDPMAYSGARRRRRQLLTDDLMAAIQGLCGQEYSDDYSSDDPPLIRGGNESVYAVRRLSSSGLSWHHAARRAADAADTMYGDARVGEIDAFRLEAQPDGSFRFHLDLHISTRIHQNTKDRPWTPSTPSSS